MVPHLTPLLLHFNALIILGKCCVNPSGLSSHALLFCTCQKITLACTVIFGGEGCNQHIYVLPKNGFKKKKYSLKTAISNERHLKPLLQ